MDSCNLSSRTVEMMLAIHVVVGSILLSGVWGKEGPTITLPKHLHTPVDSCLTIPCTFTISEKDELKGSVNGKWWKKSLWKQHMENNIAADSHLIPKVDIVGELLKKNCTSIMQNLSTIHTDNYYFRLESTQISLTFTSSVNINVTDFWPAPVVDTQVLIESVGANLTCSSEAPCPFQLPRLTWSPDLGGNVTVETRTNPDGTQRLVAVLSFVPSHQHDGLVATCASEHPLHTERRILKSTTSITLNVSYAPKAVEVRVQDPLVVSSDSIVTLGCFAKANPPVEDHRWFRLWDDQVERLNSTTNQLTAQAGSGVYICEVQNSYGRVNSTGLRLGGVGVSSSSFLWIFPASIALMVVMIIVVTTLLIRRCQRTSQPDAKIEDFKEMSANPCYGDISRKPPADDFTCSSEDIYANC